MSGFRKAQRYLSLFLLAVFLPTILPCQASAAATIDIVENPPIAVEMRGQTLAIQELVH